MTWFRVDDGWLMHPKVRAAGRNGRALWLAGGLHCVAQLTDGRIEKSLVRVLALQAEVPASSAEKLVASGLWTDEGDHYRMHGYLDYQPSRETVESQRSAVSRKRSEAGRKGAMKRWRDDGKQDGKQDGKPMAKPDGKQDGKPMAKPDGKPMAPSHPIPLVTYDCAAAAGCTPVAEPAAADGKADDEPPPDTAPAPPDEPPADIAAAALIVAQRRNTAAQAATKANPAAWKRSALEGITAEATDALATHPALDARALADLVEPAPAPPPLRPEERTQQAAQALATRDRTCPHCHGSGVTLDDDGTAHECHHPA